jgi:uncharacterized phage protein (TIGR02218 family)
MATCLKVVRLDGQVFGFTTLDEDLTFNGILYEAAFAFQQTAVRSELTVGIDNLSVIGLLSSVRIAAEDIEAGRYDGADYELFLVDFMDLSAGRAVIITGTFGELSAGTTSYEAELLSLSAKLNQQVGDLVTQTCIVQQLGDFRCAPSGQFADGATMTTYRHDGLVTAIIYADTIQFSTSYNAEDQYYTNGKVTVLTGKNAFVARDVKSTVVAGTNPQLQLQEPFPFPLLVNDQATLEAGCNRLIAQCGARFHNSDNFQGFPFVPGPAIFTLPKK